MEQEGPSLDDSNGTVDFESIGSIMPLLPLISDPHINSAEGRDDRVNFSGTSLTELMKQDEENNIVDYSMNNIIIINGEKFFVGEAVGTIPLTYNAELLPRANNSESTDKGVETRGSSSLQTVTHDTPKQIVTPDTVKQMVTQDTRQISNMDSSMNSVNSVAVVTNVNQNSDIKVPISRNQSTSNTSQIVLSGNVTGPQQILLASKTLTLDLAGQNVLVEVREEIDSNSVPLVKIFEHAQPEQEPSPKECLWKDCGKEFEKMDDLVNHVNDQHVKVSEREVEYICHWQNCPRRGKGFDARYKMLIHVRTHTKEKPHKCRLCGKSFSRLENLKIHSRSHTGEKPYRCPFEGCDKAYSNSSDRFKHVRTHQVDKPYSCKMPGCGKSYTDPSSLRKHVKIHRHFCKENEDGNIHLLSKAVSSTVSCLITTQSQALCSRDNMTSFPSLSSNPLLTSTVIVTGDGGPQQNESKAVRVSSFTEMKDLAPECVEMVDDEKNQETPLDLSRSPLSFHDND